MLLHNLSSCSVSPESMRHREMQSASKRHCGMNEAIRCCICCASYMILAGLPYPICTSSPTMKSVLNTAAPSSRISSGCRAVSFPFRYNINGKRSVSSIRLSPSISPRQYLYTSLNGLPSSFSITYGPPNFVILICRPIGCQPEHLSILTRKLPPLKAMTTSPSLTILPLPKQ